MPKKPLTLQLSEGDTVEKAYFRDVTQRDEEIIRLKRNANWNFWLGIIVGALGVLLLGMRFGFF